MLAHDANHLLESATNGSLEKLGKCAAAEVLTQNFEISPQVSKAGDDFLLSGRRTLMPRVLKPA